MTLPLQISFDVGFLWGGMVYPGESKPHAQLQRRTIVVFVAKFTKFAPAGLDGYFRAEGVQI
jgi:hypothetical protein